MQHDSLVAEDCADTPALIYTVMCFVLLSVPVESLVVPEMFVRYVTRVY